MGYDLRRFTRVVDSALLCKLCELVIENGVESLKCQHIYCDECLKSWLKLHSVCPIDSQPLIYRDVRPLTRSLCDLLLNLEIKCEFESEGCQQVVTLRLLEHHRNHCTYNPTLKVVCNSGCSLLMTQREHNSHNCLEKSVSHSRAQQNRIELLEHIVSEIKERNGWRITSGLVFLAEETCATIECKSYRAQLAQHTNTLDFYTCFEAKVIGLGVDRDHVRVGLFSRYFLGEKYEPSEDNSVINYRSNGSVHCAHDMSADVVSDDWENGDTISCGIKCAEQFTANAFNKIKLVVYFKHNNILVAEKSVVCSAEQLYPSAYVWTNGAIIECRYRRERDIIMKFR